MVGSVATEEGARLLRNARIPIAETLGTGISLRKDAGSSLSSAAPIRARRAAGMAFATTRWRRGYPNRAG
nr:hypothetical protein [Bradyrhizobium diazoefficiens]